MLLITLTKQREKKQEKLVSHGVSIEEKKATELLIIYEVLHVISSLFSR